MNLSPANCQYLERVGKREEITTEPRSVATKLEPAASSGTSKLRWGHSQHPNQTRPSQGARASIRHKVALGEGSRGRGKLHPYGPDLDGSLHAKDGRGVPRSSRSVIFANASFRRAVMGPGRPSPIRRPSIFTTGVSCDLFQRIQNVVPDRRKTAKKSKKRASTRSKRGCRLGFCLDVLVFSNGGKYKSEMSPRAANRLVASNLCVQMAPPLRNLVP